MPNPYRLESNHPLIEPLRRLGWFLLALTENASPQRSRSKLGKNPSRTFNQSFGGGGGVSIECVCGRFYFCTDETQSWSYEEGEIERWRSMKNAIEISDGGIDYVEIPQGLWVYGCPCKAAQYFEKGLMDFYPSILAYYRRRIELFKAAAKDMSDPLGKACAHPELDRNDICLQCGMDCHLGPE